MSDYTSDAFIEALKRFIGRRELPKTIYSDIGTTFQGADCEFRKTFKMVIGDPNVGNHFAADGLVWQMILPGAP